MKTSYFAKSGSNPNAIAISARVPDFYKGKRYTKLAPSWSIYKEWKYSDESDEVKNSRYERRFINEILDLLDPETVYAELCALVDGEPIIICYEKSGTFCHRYIVTKWLSKYINCNIQEIE